MDQTDEGLTARLSLIGEAWQRQVMDGLEEPEFPCLAESPWRRKGWIGGGSTSCSLDYLVSMLASWRNRRGDAPLGVPVISEAVILSHH